jgi:hypothetical protein
VNNQSIALAEACGYDAVEQTVRMVFVWQERVVMVTYVNYRNVSICLCSGVMSVRRTHSVILLNEVMSLYLTRCLLNIFVAMRAYVY